MAAFAAAVVLSCGPGDVTSAVKGAAPVIFATPTLPTSSAPTFLYDTDYHA